MGNVIGDIQDTQNGSKYFYHVPDWIIRSLSEQGKQFVQFRFEIIARLGLSQAGDGVFYIVISDAILSQIMQAPAFEFVVRY